MGDIKGEEPIKFDVGAADALQTQFKAVAGLLGSQIKRRNDLAKSAREVWRGRYAVKFDEQMKVCSDDARALAAAMDKAAGLVKTLTAEAQQEQERRTKARAWRKEHDEWKRKEDSRQWYDPRDWVGDHEPEPPNLTPADPPALPVAAPAPRSRQ
jgi:uncharacterized protein YukE